MAVQRKEIQLVLEDVPYILACHGGRVQVRKSTDEEWTDVSDHDGASALASVIDAIHLERTKIAEGKALLEEFALKYEAKGSSGFGYDFVKNRFRDIHTRAKGWIARASFS